MPKPAPYTQAPRLPTVSEQAKRWRAQLAPALARRLPELWFGGWPHSRVPSFVRTHAATHPWFVRLDVTKFYPSLVHSVARRQVVQAHQALFALPGPSQTFAREVLPWVDSLLAHASGGVGLPLGNSMSGLVATLVWVPLGLQLKAQGVPFLMFADDVLLLCRNERETRERYAQVVQYLADLQLQVNVGKVQSGALAQASFGFVGWQVKGGYLGVSPQALARFKTRVHRLCGWPTPRAVSVQVKRLNRLVDVLGHFYKFGDVASHMRTLDGFVRTEFRQWLKVQGYGHASNEAMAQLGLRSLAQIVAPKSSAGPTTVEPQASSTAAGQGAGKATGKRALASQVLPPAQRMQVTVNTTELELLMQKLLAQQKQMVGLLQKLVQAQAR